MAVTSVNTTDTFEQWRVKSNLIGTVVGDHTNSSSGDQLQTTAATVVGAINEHETQINSTVTATTTNTTNIATNAATAGAAATKGFSIAMAVALG